MKHTWFQHTDCTTEEADELIQKYQARGVKVERSLNPDYITWTVSAMLPESQNQPRSQGCWQNRMWG